MLCQGKYVGSTTWNACVQPWLHWKQISGGIEHKIKSILRRMQVPSYDLNENSRMKKINTVITYELQKYNIFHRNQCLVRMIFYVVYSIFIAWLETHPVQSEWNDSNYNNIFYYYTSQILPSHTCTGLTLNSVPLWAYFLARKL